MIATTRRGALGFGASAVAAGLSVPVLASPAPNPDAELIATAAAFMTSDSRIAQWDDGLIDLTEEEAYGAISHWYATLNSVAGMKAHTAEGLHAKVRVCHAALASALKKDGAGPHHEENAALSVLRDLLGAST